MSALAGGGRGGLTREQVGPKESDDEILSQLPEYFYDPEVDVVERLLQSMPEEGTDQYLADLIKVRNRQHDIVNSQLSDRVMSNYDAFVQGMMKIKELGDDLKTTAVLCRNGRANLYKANHDLISGPLAVVATNRKRILYKVSLSFSRHSFPTPSLNPPPCLPSHLPPFSSALLQPPPSLQAPAFLSPSQSS